MTDRTRNHREEAADEFERLRGHNASEALLKSLGSYFEEEFASEYDRFREEMPDARVPEELDRKIRAGTGAVFCLCVLSGTLLAYGNYSRGILLIDQDFLKLVTDIMSILLIWAVCIRIREKNQRAGKLLAKINRASYQVYLSHCLFLTAVTDVLAGYAVSTSVILAVRATIGYTVPFLLYAGWEKVKSGIRRQLPG